MKRLALLVAVVLLIVSVAEAAIDSADKRASVIPEPQPIPDGDLDDAGDRAQMLGEYRGFGDAGAGASTGGTNSGGTILWTIRRYN